MPVNVLVAFDGSPLSKRALTYTIETFPDARITSIYVINPTDSVIDVEAGGLPVAKEWYENAKEEATRIHTTATDLAAERNTELDTVTEVGRPAQAILEYADDHDVDQIVMGSHGRSGIDRALLGSVSETVTRRARIPVTIIS
ncbi:universal stress protein [Haloarchaeobius litoreus]|uniref:Universal stress protein n=1 Tax=Haloarchaeobius litoreus TaxID=755306 RepID=A0ABD6DPJ5_9EURY|nr:universal stress protein [Haloarchaeobius litoreus]